jgi:hypothetical protein
LTRQAPGANVGGVRDRQNSLLNTAAHAPDDELVPLSVAARVAYFQLTRINGGSHGESALAEATRLAAIALAQVAPIYASAEAGEPIHLSELQIEELLFRSARERGAPGLDNLHIRRGDLKTALASLLAATRPVGLSGTGPRT